MTDDHVASVDWAARAVGLAPPPGVFVGGEYREAAGVRDILTPRDGTTIGRLAWAEQADADRAVAEARRAFDHGPWPRLHPRDRGEVLQRFAALVDAHRDELAL